MNFYQKHIGDFNNATRHLTRVERSLYSDAIELYYDTEKPLIKDFDRLCRLLLAHTDEEKTALKSVLDEFFELTDDGYFHGRCDEEIQKYQAFKDSRSKAGKASAEQRANKKATHVEHVFNTKPTNQYPIPNTQELNSLVRNDVADDCPHKEIIALYHKHLPALTQVRSWTEKRAKQLKARWREDAKRQNLAYWEKLFQYIAESDFLMGRSSEWQADLEWITKSENFVKIIEGKYHKDA